MQCDKMEVEKNLCRMVWQFGNREGIWRTFAVNRVMFADKLAMTTFEICVAKTTERFGDIDLEATDRIDHNRYVDDLITSGTLEQVLRFMGEPCCTTGTWTRTIVKIMAAGGFKFKAMAFSGMDNPEIEAKLGGAVLGV